MRNNAGMAFFHSMCDLEACVKQRGQVGNDQQVSMREHGDVSTVVG